MLNPFRDAAANDFASALEGRPGGDAAAHLAALARELRDCALAEPQSHADDAGRAALRRFVLQQAHERRSRPAGRLKGATVSLAAIAGSGLVIASAASGSNPVTLAVDAVREIPIPAIHIPTGPKEVAFEAEVISSSDEGLQVRAQGGTIHVELPPADRATAVDGAPVRLPDIEAGTVVRITGREPDRGTVAATKIEVVPEPKPASTLPAVLANGTPATNPVAAAPTRTLVASATSSAPTATPTKPPPAAGIGIGAIRTATPKPLPTATATALPTKTPTKPPLTATVNATADAGTPVADTTATPVGTPPANLDPAVQPMTADAGTADIGTANSTRAR